jgi:hypothetical protein
MKKLIVLLLSLIAGTAVWFGGQGGGVTTGKRIISKSPSLKKMSLEASTIFIGSATEVTFVNRLLKVKGREIPVKDKKITFLVEVGVKGVKKGEKVTVLQSGLFSSDVKVGGRYLWFLQKKDKNGYQTPFSLRNGHFDLDGNKAISRMLNHKLWGKNLFPKGKAEAIIEKSLGELKYDPSPYSVEVLASASKLSPEGKKLPVALVLAAAKHYSE